MNEIAIYVIEKIADVGVAALGEKIKDRRISVAARSSLKSYLERQEKLNYFCTIEEKIDFGGLAQYIQTKLAEDMDLRLFGNDNERAEAHKRIIENAKSFASSHTQLSEKRAVQLVSDTMNILRKYYRKGVSRELRFVDGEISEHVDKATAGLQKHIDQSISEATHTIIDEVSSDPFSLSANLALAKDDQIDELTQNLIVQEKALNAVHKLAPFYGFRLEESKRLISIPLMKESTSLYPPHFQMNVKNVRIGEKEADVINDGIFEYSYRHQVPIHFDVISATKKLGSVDDPIQTEAKEMEGTHIYIYPNQFPQARAYSLYVNDEVFFDYLLMRTKEIQEDGTAILSNCEQQNAPYNVSFSLNVNTRAFTINVKTNADDNKVSLKYRKFLKALSTGGRLKVKDLESGAFLIEGCLSSGKATDLSTLDQEIDLLLKVISIEDYVGKSIRIPETITVGDHKLIERIYAIIAGYEYSGLWKEFEIGLEFAEETRERILEMEPNMYIFMICQMANVTLFDAKFSIPIKREYYDAKVKDLEKLKKKVLVLDEGDTFQIKIYADNDNGSKYIDRLAEDEIKENGM